MAYILNNKTMAKKQQPKLSYGPNMGLIAGEAAVAQSEANLGNTFGAFAQGFQTVFGACLLYTSPSPRDS